MTSIRRPLTIAAVLAFATLGAACGGGSDSTSADSAADAVAEVPETAAPTAPPDADTANAAGSDTANAPDILQFTSPLVGGGELDAATLSSKPTAFWFWSPT